jgi:hypothetical protein
MEDEGPDPDTHRIAHWGSAAGRDAGVLENYAENTRVAEQKETAGAADGGISLRNR